MATPTTFPSAKTWVGIAKEVTQGTAVTSPFTTTPQNLPEFSDDPKWLPDEAMRGSMAKTYGMIQGPLLGSYSQSGSVFLSWFPHHLLNIFGELATTGPASSIYTHAVTLLNSGTAQPPSHTQLDWQGLPATTRVRVYPGCSHSELTIKGNAESTLMEWAAKGNCFPSSIYPTSEPSSAPDTTSPIASWRAELAFGGALPGAKKLVVRDWEFTFTREIAVQHTSQNSQSPYIIQRGDFTATAKFFVSKPSDETFYDYMRNNTQPQVQFLISNGLAGALAQTLQIDGQQFAATIAKVNRGDEAVGYDIEGEFIANTTNVGASGGFSPCKVTVTNAVASY